MALGADYAPADPGRSCTVQADVLSRALAKVMGI